MQPLGSTCGCRNNMLSGAVFRFGSRELAARVWALWIHSAVFRPGGSLRKRASCDARQRPLSDMHGRCFGSGASSASSFGANEHADQLEDSLGEPAGEPRGGGAGEVVEREVELLHAGARHEAERRLESVAHPEEVGENDLRIRQRDNQFLGFLDMLKERMLQLCGMRPVTLHLIRPHGRSCRPTDSSSIPRS